MSKTFSLLWLNKETNGKENLIRYAEIATKLKTFKQQIKVKIGANCFFLTMWNILLHYIHNFVKHFVSVDKHRVILPIVLVLIKLY